jgi:Tol biopolymer transport system component
LWVVEVSPAVPPPRIVTQYMGRNIPCSWNTFSFDETRIVTASGGVMTLRNTMNGAPINTVPLPMGRFGTQPDWAPDSTLLAFVDSTSNRDRGIDGAQIAVIETRPGDAWGTRTVLVGSGRRGDSAQFPSFSWDSQWIAFARSTGNGQNDLTTDLWLMTRDGRDPRALVRANTIINAGAITTATIQDNMPTWAPSGVPNDYAWIAFSSTRDYGVVLSRASRLGQREQLWVAAIDLERARMGTTDPSAPAFRLPAQDLNEDTHRPFWAEDRIRLDPDGGVRDASTPDAASDAAPDVQRDAGTDAACVTMNGDCSAGRCCPGLTCWDFGGGSFQCTNAPL